jgi:hypothetical protein
MTRRTIMGVVAAVSSLTFLGCNDYNFTEPRPGIVVTPQFTLLPEGLSTQLEATLNGEPVEVTWTSDDESVLSVTPDGTATAVAEGITAAIAHLVSDPTVTGSSSITVVPLQELESGVPLEGLSSDDDQDSFIYYKIVVPPGTTNLTVTFVGGTGDGDLLLRAGVVPNFDENDCASYKGANAELCTIDDPEPGVWYIGIALWEPYADATLTATLTPAP